MSWLPFEGLWGKFIIAAAVIVVVSQVAHRLLRPLVMRGSAHSTMLLSLVRRCDGPVQLLVPLAAMQVALQALPDSLPGLGFVEHVNAALTIGAITWMAMAAIRGVGDGIIELHPANVADNLAAR